MKDWRGGRAASVNIIPSSTGAAKVPDLYTYELMMSNCGCRSAMAQRNLNKSLLFRYNLLSTKCFEIETSFYGTEFEQTGISVTCD